MLTSLRIKNLALVDNLRVDFQPGLNVITGETGAGKSILLGALSLLMGERADKRMIRTGEEACGAEASFELADPAAVNAALEPYGVEPCAEGRLVIRRILKAGGANQILVNDSPVTLQVLKLVGDLLVDLHGPHDHQSLLRPDFQLDLLDAFGHHARERAAYADAYRALQELQARRAELARGQDDVPGQVEFLTYRARELEEAALEEGEEERILEEHRVAGHAQRILELGGQVADALLDREDSALNALGAAQKGLEELARLLPEAEAWRAEARAAATTAKELHGAIHHRLGQMETDPARLEWLDQRLAVYQKLKRKYHAGVPELLGLLRDMRRQLEDLAARGERLAELDQERARAEAAARARGAALGALRRGQAGRLAEAITRELRALGFARGAFEVALREAPLGPSGADEVEFGFAPNVGEARQPLHAIASSGEISRVMLAVKVVLARHDRIPVLVFDEIDANVGGELGAAVGRKLAEVARTRQVICVTHLPQVAACGNHHLAVEKTVHDGRTFTRAQALADEQRVGEIARMLGGRDVTSVVLKHARELLHPAP